MPVCHNPCLEYFYLILGTVQENEPVPDIGSHGQASGGTDAGAGPVRTGPDVSADPVLYPALPDAIAPSLATTPEFARRGTIWCHALEVSLIKIFKLFEDTGVQYM